MVDFSNIFILFTYLRSLLASWGINLPQERSVLLVALLAAAVVLALIGVIKKNRSDANCYNMKKFFLVAAGVCLVAAALMAFTPLWPVALGWLAEKTGGSPTAIVNILVVGLGAALLTILLPMAGKASREANNSSLLNRRQSLFVWATLVGVLLAGYIFYAISSTAFVAAMAVVLFSAEVASVLFWFYDPFTFIASRLIRVKPQVSCPPTPHKLNRFAVLGCAHNEAAVIEQLIQSLYATVYPKNSYDIYVICDNCTDNTAEVVRKAGAIAMERHDPDHRGKGFGLEWMFGKLNEEKEKGNVYDAYIILDADNLVNESFLDEINYKMNEGYEILQAYLGCKNPRDTWISRCYSYAYWVSDAQYQEGHSRVGLTAQMGGTGMVLRPSVLDEVGWHTDSLTEDLVLTSRYVLQTNRACCWVEKAKLYDEKPLKMKPSVKQRTRWMQGHMDALFKYGGPLLIASIKNRSLKQFDMAFYLARPLINLILVVTYLVRLGFNLFAPHSPLSAAFIMGTETSTVLLIATVVLQGYLLFNEYYARYIHWFFLQLVFTFSWYPAIFRGLIKHNEKYWVSTVHTRSLSIDSVREDAVLQEAKERLRGLDNIHRLPLGQILLKAAVITRAQLDEALAVQKERGGFLGDIIVETKAIAPEMLDAYLAIQREMRDTAQVEGESAGAPRIGTILTDSGLITPVQLEAALAFQAQHNVLLGEAIIATHIMPMELLKSFLDVQKVLDMNYVSRDSAKHLIEGLLSSRADSLGSILYNGGLISAQQLKVALEKQQQTGLYIGRTLVDLGFLTPQALDVILEFQVDGRFYIENKAELDEFLSSEGDWE